MTPGEMLAGRGHVFVRITKAPDAMWIGVEGPLRTRMTSEPMIKDGLLVFGAVSGRELKGGPHPPGGYFFSVDPDGDPQWDFELLEVK